MMRARVLALAAVATLLVPKAIASDASSASEGDHTALLVAGLGGAAAAALGWPPRLALVLIWPTVSRGLLNGGATLRTTPSSRRI